eukprot:13005-Heterococcus_DN1.PRE.1
MHAKKALAINTATGVPRAAARHRHRRHSVAVPPQRHSVSAKCSRCSCRVFAHHVPIKAFIQSPVAVVRDPGLVQGV